MWPETFFNSCTKFLMKFTHLKHIKHIKNYISFLCKGYLFNYSMDKFSTTLNYTIVIQVQTIMMHYERPFGSGHFGHRLVTFRPHCLRCPGSSSRSGSSQPARATSERHIYIKAMRLRPSLISMDWLLNCDNFRIRCKRKKEELSNKI